MLLRKSARFATIRNCHIAKEIGADKKSPARIAENEERKKKIMEKEMIISAAVFVLILICGYFAIERALKGALKIADTFDDDIQKSLTQEDYKINNRDKILLLAGSLVIIITPLICGSVYPGITAYYVVSAVLLIAGIVDLKIRYAPNTFALIILAVAGINIFLIDTPIVSALEGMFFPGIIFLIACVFFPSFLGGADIKILIALGACLGSMQTLTLYLVSCVALVILYLPFWIKRKIGKEKEPIFVPALVGFYFAFLFIQYEPQALQLFDI